jgi:hypothetical protein
MVPPSDYHSVNEARNPDRFIASCTSWEDFYERIRALPTRAAKGAVFERLTQLFLQTTPEYRKLQHVWKLRDVPIRVRRRLNLPGPDEGIDLLARTRRGVARRPRRLKDWLPPAALRAGTASSPMRQTVRVDFARRDLSGRIARPAGPQGRIQPGVGGNAGRLAHKGSARPSTSARLRRMASTFEGIVSKRLRLSLRAADCEVVSVCGGRPMSC